jgi:hypothetical protein
MAYHFRGIVILLSVCVLTVSLSAKAWDVPSEVSLEQVIADSNEILGMSDIPITSKEDIFRIRAVGMDWDVGGAVFEPRDTNKIPRGADGKKVGVFLIHGGSGDHRSKESVARLLAGKFGFKVVTLSYPGRINLNSADRNWPGDTIKADGSVRTPIWSTDSIITREQYQIVEDDSLGEKYGKLTLACAREGTEMYHRMAGWEVAFETAGKEMMRRNLPADEFSIYIHGHSTGGPFSFMLSQRVENIAGVIGMDNSPFGYIFRVQTRSSGNPTGKQYGDLPFNCLHIRTWRDSARYVGPEALMLEGPESLMYLPNLMDRVFDRWEKGKTQPNFKAEGPIHFGSAHQLANAARATAKRLKLDRKQTDELINQYVNYSRELQGIDVKPVPPVLFGIAQASADHSLEKYKAVTLPMYAAMDPPPKVSVIQFQAGIHGYTSPGPDLPMGPFPSVAKLWRDAIMGGYFLDNQAKFKDR